MIGLLPLLAMADRGDIGGLSTDLHPQTAAPTVFIYDGHPGGAGITRRGYELFEQWVERRRCWASVPWERGCPILVPSPESGGLDRAARQGRATAAACGTDREHGSVTDHAGRRGKPQSECRLDFPPL